MNLAGPLSGPRSGALSGLGVVVTRDEPPGGPLGVRLEIAGARVLHWPAMVIAPPSDPAALAAGLAALESFDWLVLTSPHAVEAVAGRRATLPPRLRVAVVGASTAAAAREHGWHVDRMPQEFQGEALLASFAEAPDGLAGRRVLFPASDLAAQTLPAGLAALGAEVVRVEAYRITTAPVAAALFAARLETVARGEVDVVTFASPSAVDGLAGALGEPALAQLLDRSAAAVIGPTTAGALARRGRTADAVADPATLDGLVAAVALAHARFTERKPTCRC